jgi:YD repeat-containing protein
MKIKFYIQLARRSFIATVISVCCLLAFTSAQAQVNLTNGLWAYYGFNDGTATNLIPGSPAGTLVGNPVVTNGWFQNALSFDGSSSTVTFGSVGYFSPVTASAFVKLAAPVATGTEQDIINNNQGNEGFILCVVQTNNSTFFCARFRARVYSWGYFYDEVRVLSLTSPVIGQFYHVALTFDGSTLNLYVNGVNEARQSITGNYGWYGNSTSPDLAIGSRDNTGNYFNGIIDEVYIYNRVLSVAEIQQLETPPLAPYITQQPVGVTTTLGSNATFTVSASAQGALPLFYQWQRNGTNLVANTNLVGVASSFLSISNIQSTNLGFYSVVITNVSGSVTSSCVLLGITNTLDTDGDGIPDWWENTFGLNPNNPNDATNHPPGDKLTYLQKYLYGLDPLTIDTDGDGISDYDELFVYGTNPQKADTSGGGIPDGWEIQNGLNPLVNSATNQVGFTGVTYLQIYQYNLTHTNQLDPRNYFPQAGTSLYEFVNGGAHTNRLYYDQEDRLVGEEFSSGISIAYTYDGNGNIVRQTILSRVSETNGLPVLWQFLNGLTNGTATSGPNGDPDGDGWSNLQEYLAGTNPNNSNSVPSLSVNPGANIATLAVPFTPTNWVVAAGQLNSVAGDEIVVGADGNATGKTNSLFILTPGASGWQVTQLPVGAMGITSIAVGQPTNRPNNEIYVGLRGASGRGQVVEFAINNGIWQTNIIAVSSNEPAFVAGIRQSGDLLVNMSTNGMSEALLSFTSDGTNWSSTLISSNASHRGSPIRGSIYSHAMKDSPVRLLDKGGIELNAGISEAYKDNILLPTNVIYNTANGNWYFTSPTSMTFFAAQSYCTNYHGNLSVPGNATDNTWISSHFTGLSWIGLYWSWNGGCWITYNANGSLASPYCGWNGYANWYSGQPYYSGSPPCAVLNYGGQGNWAIYSAGSSLPAIGNVPDPVAFFTNQWLLPEPPATNRLLSYGISLASGLPRPNQTNSSSLFYAFADDQNLSGQLDAGDVFILAEYMVSGNTWTSTTLFQVPITSAKVAQSFGLAAVNFTGTGKDTLFTGEPDGRVYSWTGNDATNPLQRQLFSDAYVGKAWQSMCGVQMPSMGKGLAGLMINPTNQNSCGVIFWTPQPVLPTPQAQVTVVETAPSAAVVPSSNPLGSNAVVTVRLWDNEGNASTPFLQYQILGTTNWQNSTLTTMDGVAYSLATRVTALPSGYSHTLRWNALADVGANVVTNILLRACAQDYALLGSWSQPTPFQLNTSIAVNPTNPPVTFTEITPVSGGIQFNWQGSSNAWLYLQRSPTLAGTNVNWVNIWTGAPPTLMFGSYTDFFGTNQMEFYRLQIVSP